MACPAASDIPSITLATLATLITFAAKLFVSNWVLRHEVCVGALREAEEVKMECIGTS